MQQGGVSLDLNAIIEKQIIQTCEAMRRRICPVAISPCATLNHLTAAKRRSGRSTNSLRSNSADRFSSTASKQQ